MRLRFRSIPLVVMNYSIYNLRMKNKLLLFSTITFFVLFLLALSFLGGIFFTKKQTDDYNESRVTSRIIVDKIQNEAFLVTKTVFLDQETQIKVDQGSSWSNFWWGQIINAEGLIRIDLGVDLKKITENEISINRETKEILIKMPEAEALDISLSGKIKVSSQSGLLKFLLENDPNQDHNLALNQLKEDATSTVMKDASLLDEARNDTLRIIQLLFKDTGYTVIFVS